MLFCVRVNACLCACVCLRECADRPGHGQLSVRVRGQRGRPKGSKNKFSLKVRMEEASRRAEEEARIKAALAAGGMMAHGIRGCGGGGQGHGEAR